MTKKQLLRPTWCVALALTAAGCGETAGDGQRAYAPGLGGEVDGEPGGGAVSATIEGPSLNANFEISLSYAPDDGGGVACFVDGAGQFATLQASEGLHVDDDLHDNGLVLNVRSRFGSDLGGRVTFARTEKEAFVLAIADPASACELSFNAATSSGTASCLASIVETPAGAVAGATPDHRVVLQWACQELLRLPADLARPPPPPATLCAPARAGPVDSGSPFASPAPRSKWRRLVMIAPLTQPLCKATGILKKGNF